MVDFCTVTGSITDVFVNALGEVTVEFETTKDSLSRWGNTVVSSQRKRLKTAEDGTLSVTLIPGEYLLSFITNSRTKDEVIITVPDAADAILAQLIAAPPPEDLDAAALAVLDAQSARDEANTSAVSAAASATDASVSKTDAETAEASTIAARDDFFTRYIGQYANNAAADASGYTISEGVFYWNSTTKGLLVYNGTIWNQAVLEAGDALVPANNLSDLINTVTARTNLGLGSAATTASADYATAAQGATADTAVQPAAIANATNWDTAFGWGNHAIQGYLTTVSWTALTGKPTTFTPSAHTHTKIDITDFSDGDYATAAQGTKADTAHSWGDHALAGYVTSVNGGATADALTTPRIISLDGDVTGSVAFDGSANVTITAAIADDSHAHVIGNVDGLQAALDSKATTAQGATADTALQPTDIGVSVQGYSAVLAGSTASFTTVDETKLDGIEAGANVTDTANVTAAGALMDSEVTNLAQVKAFSSADYATAAQGGVADSAVQPADLSAVATSGAYSDLSGLPTLGTAAATAITDYATAAQGALAATALQPSDMVGSVRTLWVDPAGDDAADGDLPTAPLQTIGAAVAKSEPGDIIRVRSGTYTETLPLILPRDVSVFGDGLRNVEVRPTAATETNNIWLVDSGAYLWGMTFARHQAGSFAVAFNAAADNTALGATSLGAFISKSPYIQNCSSYTAAQDAGIAGSTSVGATGGGMEVDGAKCALNSPIKSMVVDSYTQVNLNGPGCTVKNDAYAQLVSFFGTFCSEHVRAESGGQVNLSNSTTNFGTYGLVADGRSTTPIFSGTASAALDAVTTITVDTMTASRIGPSSRPAAGMVFEVATVTYTVTGALPNGTGWDVNFYPTLDGALSGGETVEFFQRSQISTGGHVMEFVGSGTNYNALPWFGGVPIPANEIVEGGGGRVFFSSTDQLGNFRVGPQFDVNGTTGAVTINTDQFNLSGLNFIGPFSRDGFTSVGVQLQEISNNTSLLSSTGAADGNTAPTQFAVKTYLETNYTLTSDLATVATTGAYGDLSGLPTLGTAAATAATDYATAAQGALADSATQPGDFATVATTGAYGDLSGRPTLGTLSIQNADEVSFTGSIQEQVFALTGTTHTLDPSNGTVQTHTLSGSTTYIDSFANGETITLMVDDGAGQTITWPTMTWVNGGGAAPTLATTGYTVVALWKVGTTLYGALVGDGS